MEQIHYFDKCLFENGKLAVIVNTLEQLDRIIEWLPKTHGFELSQNNKISIHDNIVSNKKEIYFRYDTRYHVIYTGYSFDTAQAHSVSCFCLAEDFCNLQIPCEEFEKFLEAFW